MKNYSNPENQNHLQLVSGSLPTTQNLSEDAFYVLELASRLKKLLGNASLQYFIETGEEVDFTIKAVG